MRVRRVWGWSTWYRQPRWALLRCRWIILRELTEVAEPTGTSAIMTTTQVLITWKIRTSSSWGMIKERWSWTLYWLWKLGLGTKGRHRLRTCVTLESQTTGSLLQTGTTTMQRMRNRKGSMLQLTLPKLRNWLMVDIIYLLEVMQSKAYLEKN